MNYLTRLFIGGISQNTTDSDLRDYFESFGPINSCFVVYDKKTRASKGYAFLECVHKRTADRILEVSKHEILGRVVEVTEALGKLSKTSTKGISKGIRRLFVGGLPHECTKDHLFDYFSSFGEVANAYIIYDPKTGNSKNFGYVEFADNLTTEAVLKQHTHEILNKQVTVEINNNSRKLANLHIQRENKGQTELNQTAKADTHTSKLIETKPDGKKLNTGEGCKITLKEKKEHQGIIPSHMFWHECSARQTLNATCKDPNTENMVNCSSTLQNLEDRDLTNEQFHLSYLSSVPNMSKNQNICLNQRKRKSDRYHHFYRHLKMRNANYIDQSRAFYSNNSYRYESISSKRNRVAKLQAAMTRLKF